MTIDVYQHDGAWFVRLIARNGRVVFDTGAPCGLCNKRPEGYRRKQAAVDIAEKIAGGIDHVSIES